MLAGSVPRGNLAFQAEADRRMINNGTKPSFEERLLSLFWRRPADTLAERTRRRVTLHLIPFLFFLYILAYLDRVNVSVVESRLESPRAVGGVGFDTEIFGFGSGLFFWGYWILEIPSTVVVVRWGARWVFARILILWGICAALEGAIGTPFAARLFSWLPHVPEGTGGVATFINGLHADPKYQFYLFRFLLGFFEGGFFPSVIVYLSIWFRAEDRGKSIAAFMVAIPLSSCIGVPLSSLLLDVEWLGLPGWRWIFILEGILPFLAGFLTLFFLPDNPTKARWLPAEERAWLLGELDREHRSKQAHGHWIWLNHLGMVLLLTVVYFFLNVTSYGLGFFLPAILASQLHVSDKIAGLTAGPAYLIALIAMLINGWHSDRTGERYWHAAVPMALLGGGILLAAALDGVPIVPVFVMIFCVGTFWYAHLPAFWPIPTRYLGAVVAASAIGFINMIGNLGGSVGPTIVGKAAKGQASFAPALYRMAPWPVAGAVIILIVGYTRPRRLSAREKDSTNDTETVTTSANPASAVDRPGSGA
jgi:MFS transporter, ACS family, tartrate transporter